MQFLAHKTHFSRFSKVLRGCKRLITTSHDRRKRAARALSDTSKTRAARFPVRGVPGAEKCTVEARRSSGKPGGWACSGSRTRKDIDRRIRPGERSSTARTDGAYSAASRWQFRKEERKKKKKRARRSKPTVMKTAGGVSRKSAGSRLGVRARNSERERARMREGSSAAVLAPEQDAARYESRRIAFSA